MKDLDQLLEEKKRLEAGLQTPFWKLLSEFIEAQVTMRRQAFFASRIDSLDKAFSAAQAQSEVAGLQFVLALPQVMLQDLRADIQQLMAAATAEEEEETPSV